MQSLSINTQTSEEALYDKLSNILLRNPSKKGGLAVSLPEEIIQKIMKDAEFNLSEGYEKLKPSLANEMKGVLFGILSFGLITFFAARSLKQALRNNDIETAKAIVLSGAADVGLMGQGVSLVELVKNRQFQSLKFALSRDLFISESMCVEALKEASKLNPDDHKRIVRIFARSKPAYGVFFLPPRLALKEATSLRDVETVLKLIEEYPFPKFRKFMGCKTKEELDYWISVLPSTASWDPLKFARMDIAIREDDLNYVIEHARDLNNIRRYLSQLTANFQKRHTLAVSILKNFLIPSTSNFRG